LCAAYACGIRAHQVVEGRIERDRVVTKNASTQMIRSQKIE
jgi:hypothetical protein